MYIYSLQAGKVIVELIISHEHPVEAVEDQVEQWEDDPGPGVHLRSK